MQRGKVDGNCARCEGMGEGLEELLVGAKLEGDDEGGEEVESVLEEGSG